MENADTPARFKISFREHELRFSPLNTEQDVVKRLKVAFPAVPFQKLYLENIEEDANTRSPFGDDDRVVEAPVTLKQNLMLNTTAIDPKNRATPMFVYMDIPKAGLVGTSLQPLITTSEGADAATVAECAKKVYETISNELSETIAVSMKKDDIVNHFKATAFRGGAVIDVDRVKFAVCMLGECLPKLNDLEKILGKPDSHYPADAVGYIKKLKFMPGGSQGIKNVPIKKNPGKALVKIDGKLKEYLIGPAVEDEILLFSTPTFELEIGAVDDGDDMRPDCDFDNAKHAWAEWIRAKMQDDVEKMKSAALFLVSKDGDPKACCGGQVEAFLKSVLGYDLCTAEFALHTYDAPYVQKFLVPYLQRQSETKTIIVAGPPSTQKSNFAKSLFGEYHFATSVDALKLCSWYKCRNIIADDFDFTTLKDGSVESLKQLFLVDVNSEDVADVNCRFSPAKVPVNVRRTFTTNCLTLEAFLKMHVPPEHWDAIASRVEWVLLSDVHGVPGIPDGTNLVPQMELDALAELTGTNPSVRIAEGQCWMMALPVFNFRHPNARDGDAPAAAAWAAAAAQTHDDGGMPPEPEPEPEPEQQQQPDPVAEAEPAAEEEQAEAEAVAEAEPATEEEQAAAEAATVVTVATAATVSVSIDTRIAVALRSVDPVTPQYTPGISPGIVVLSEIETVKEITTHPAFPLVARAISDAFKPDVPWTAQTRDRLANQIKGKLPEFDDYEIMHLTRSLSYVYELENIKCKETYYQMSFHVKEAGIKLMEIGKKPNDVMNYLRDDDELGVVSVDIIPNDDMV